MKRYLTILVVLLCAACASSSAKPGEEATAEPVVEQTQFKVRYNPADCACPPYEVQVGDRWQRVFFDIEDRTQIDALQNASALETLVISARLTDREQAAENGVRYRVVRDLR